MTQQEEFKSCAYRVKDEGIEYTFKSYSNWTEIKDPTFQQLRRNYLDAEKQLKDYVNEKASLEQE